MQQSTLIKTYYRAYYMREIAIVALMLFFDTVWINSNMTMYKATMESVQKAPLRINMTAAAITYLFMFLSIYYIALPMAAANKNFVTFLGTAQTAGLVGLLTYGVYNFTNMSTFVDYSWSTAAIDTLWGGLLFTMVVYIVMRLDRL